MSEQTHAEQPEPSDSASGLISWKVAAILAVLALIAGVWLGRVAFFFDQEESPRIVSIEVEDDDLEVGGNVQYIDKYEIYILTIDTMPPPDEGQVFQVWVQRDDLVVSAGVLNPTSRTFVYSSYSGRYDTLFVTAEPSPFGSEQPSSPELITADLTELEDEEEDD